MNATRTTSGLIATLMFSLIALPALAAPPAGRANDPRSQIDHRGRTPARDVRHSDRRDIGPVRADPRKDVTVQVQIGSGPVIVRHPEPVRYEIRTETVLVEPARYEMRTETVLVQEGYWQERVIPGRRELLRDSRGNLHEVQVTPDRVERVWHPPVYETRTVKVLVPARYETRTVRVPVYDHYDARISTTQAAIGVGLQVLGQILVR